MKPTALLVCILVFSLQHAQAQKVLESPRFSSVPTQFRIIDSNASNPAPSEHKTRPSKVKLQQGFLEYQFVTRSLPDSPFQVSNLSQHQLNGSAAAFVANKLPIQISFFLRRSNSSLFRDINDIQIQLDAGALQRLLQQQIQVRRTKQLSLSHDSTAISFSETLQKAADIKKNWLNEPSNKQKLIEAYEQINVPGLSKQGVSDSSAKHFQDSIVRQAQKFIEFYASEEAEHSRMQNSADSIKRRIKELRSLTERLDAFAQSGRHLSFRERRKLRQRFEQLGLNMPKMPRTPWIQGVRALRLGKQPINNSELTAKNISISGLHFEYQSWYYFSLTAGLLENRFREFVLSHEEIKPQPFYQVKFGVGVPEQSHLYMSFFSGEKHQYSLSSLNSNGLTQTRGIAVESRYKVKEGVYFQGEVAQSFGSDIRRQDSLLNKSPSNLSGNNVRAFALQFHGMFPNLGVIADANYKSLGANYQAFNRFQSNSAQEIWNFKVQKHIWRKMVKLSLGVGKNNFSNPFVLQAYNANIVQQTVNFSFQKKKWPSISFGYQPVSQITALGDQLVETQYQATIVSANYYYKIGEARSSTYFLYSTVRTKLTDSVTFLSNSRNYYLHHGVYFKSFDLTFAYARTIAPSIAYNVIENSVHLPFRKDGSLTIGLKLNEMNGSDVRVGELISMNCRIWRELIILRFERGFWPGLAGRLVENNSGSVGIRKTFK